MDKNQALQVNSFGLRAVRRGIILLLVFAMMQCILIPGITVADAADTASTGGIIDIGAANVTHRETLTDNGDGTYTLTVEMTAKGTHDDISVSETVARNSYFTASHDGLYLVELWGGDGAGGEATPYSYNGQASVGGQGGYIYGVVRLNKGDTLFYTLGGNGVQTESTSSGGGVNGDGGNHGDLGSYAVGGGGGYSAVFLFEAGSGFESTYLDKNGNVAVETILESDRLTRYIMIAGGGGGGGAGNSWNLLESATGTPDGGDGGSLTSPIGTVGNGYFFAGSDGDSSGTSVDYVGHGGTNVPGAINDTFSDQGWFEGKQPNDWTGTANPDYDGGSGGSGNFRGGAGGGGFSGGSGGVQSSLLSAINVGGGGGGSSYISKEIYEGTNYQSGSYPLTGTNPSSKGGAVVITCLGSTNTEDAVQMANFSFGGTVSDYFTIQSATVGTGFSTDGTTADSFTVSGDIHANDLVLTLVLARKDNFVGGNNVPLITETHYATGGTPVSVTLDAACTYANVPLNFGITTYTHVTNDVTAAYEQAELYEDVSAQWSTMLGYGTYATASGYNVTYEGAAVSTYPVHPGDDGVGQDGAGTYTYHVSYTVTPGDTGVAAVGEVVTAKTVEADAIISIITGQTEQPSDKVTLLITKTLRFSGGTYTLSVNVQGSARDTVEAKETTPDKPADTLITFHDPERTYSVNDKSGYYLIQVWGGNGGEGEKSLVAAGGAGGKGGYVSSYVYLEKNSTLSFTIGANGTPGSGGQLFDRNPGTGGGYTAVILDGNYLMIAGGGGGGQGAGLSAGAAGNSGAIITTASDQQPSADNLEEIYNGKDGSQRNAGANYLYSGLQQTDPNDADNELKSELPEHSADEYSDGGAVKITCLQLDPGDPVADATEIANIETTLAAMLTNYTVSAGFTQFFTVNSITGTDLYADDGALAMTVDSDLSGVTGISPVTSYSHTTDENTKNVTVTANINFTVNFNLTPAAGFLGGNDVPLLSDMTLYQKNAEGNDAITPIPVIPQEATDYANVEVTAPDANHLTVYNPTYVLGTGQIDPNRLYSWNQTDSVSAYAGAWQAAYVDITGPSFQYTDWTPSVSSNTNKITVSVTPKELPGSGTIGAVVVPEVAGKSISKTATVNIVNQIFYSGLVNVTTSHIPESVEGYDRQFYLHPLDTNYAAILTPAPGYILPETITVRAGGATLTAGVDYVYYSDTGEVVVYAKSIGNQPVSISAEGQKQTYQIFFISTDVPSLTKTFTYESGTALTDMDLSNTGSASEYLANSVQAAPEKTGYTFQWAWDGIGVGESVPTHMPAGNQWVFGSYIADSYTLTVNYYALDADGNQTTTKVADSVTQTVYYDASYSVVSPNVDGYLAQVIEVAGTIGQEDPNDPNITVSDKTVTVNVYYQPLENGLNIVYVYADGTGTTVMENYQFATDEVYSQTLTQVSGYTIYDTKEDTDEQTGKVITSVSGTMDANGETVYVYYRPNIYTVTYKYQYTDINGNPVADTTDAVQFNQVYGYDPATGSYGALPTPLRPGYSFGGWYETEDCSGEQVKAETVMDTSGDHNLYAKWEIQTFTVTVNYLYEDGTKAAETKVAHYPYDTAYTITSPAIEGFVLKDSTQSVISGTMGNQNLVFDVIYQGKEHTLTIYYKYADGTEAFPTVTQTVRYKQPYNYVSPAAPENYACSQDIVSGEMPNDDVTVTVYYRSQEQAEDTLISVTVTWGNLNFSYDYGTWNPENHSYENPTITSPSNNTITVTSDKGTNVEVIVAYEYQDRGVYPLDVYFTLDRVENRENELLTPIVLTGDPAADARPSQVVYVWVEGQLPYGYAGQSLTLGQCTVTISAGADIPSSGGGSS